MPEKNPADGLTPEERMMARPETVVRFEELAKSLAKKGQRVSENYFEYRCDLPDKQELVVGFSPEGRDEIEVSFYRSLGGGERRAVIYRLQASGSVTKNIRTFNFLKGIEDVQERMDAAPDWEEGAVQAAHDEYYKKRDALIEKERAAEEDAAQAGITVLTEKELCDLIELIKGII